MWKNSLQSLKLAAGNPVIITPLLLLAVFEFACLTLFYYMPRPPVSYILAPLVRAFAGEVFLHYPLNFIILGRLAFIARALIYPLLGGIFLAMTVFFVSQLKVEEKSAGFFANLNRALRLYPKIFVLVMVYSIAALAAYKLPRIIGIRFFGVSAGKFPVSLIIFLISFLLMVLVESGLIFAPVSMIFQKKGIFDSIKKSFRIFSKHFFSVLSFILIFRLINLGTFFLKNNIPGILRNHFPTVPEVSIIILALEITVLFLINFLIVSTATQFFLAKEVGHET